MVVIRDFEDAFECVDECLAVGHEKEHGLTPMISQEVIYERNVSWGM